MIGELGHFALMLSLLLCFVQGVFALLGAQRGRVAWMRVGKAAVSAQFGCVLLAYFCLSWLFVQSDFSLLLVAQNSHSNTPLLYKLTGVWGSHEGSLLLWSLSLSLWTLSVAVFSRHLPEAFVARVLGVLGWINGGFLAFLLLTSNPFLRLLPAAADGRDLNPLLQDPGMIIHPPLLYMGYVGFSVAFAFAVAALLTGRLDAAWARWSRPWTTVAWVFLTAGIAVGSGWAYYELGWGGWWFWDPVENASFIPWLVGTALMHSLAVTEKRGAFRNWTVLLAIATFSLCLMGTFIVRSGVVTSVHAFATDPARGIFILVLLALVVGISLALFAWRAGALRGGGVFALFSRDASLLVNNVLLVVAAAAVLLGTLYPLFVDALGLGKLSVGAPYFETVFVPLMVPVVVLMGISPFLRWKEDQLQRVARKLWPALVLMLIGMAVFFMLSGHASPLSMTGIALFSWVLASSVQLLLERGRTARGHWRLRSIAAGWWGMWLAHLGVGVFILGVTVVRSFGQDLDISLHVGQGAAFAGHHFVLEEVGEKDGPNYDAFVGRIAIYREGSEQRVALLKPEKRLYHAQQMPMTEAAIHVGLAGDLYVSLGEQLEDGQWVVSLHDRPFISWLWAGCILMGVGGIVAISDRRYRMRAAARAPANAAGAKA